MAMNQRLMRPIASGPTYHQEAMAWRTAALANGGTGITASTMQAVSDFCTAIDAAGIRSAFLRLSLVCGGNLAAARTPLYRGASPGGTQYGPVIDANVGPLAEEDYTQATGVYFNGLSKYLDTGLTIGSLYSFGAGASDTHASVYLRTNDFGPHFGGQDYAGAYSSNAVALDAGSSGGYIADYAPVLRIGNVNYGEGEIFTAAAHALGHHLAMRSSDSAGVYLQAGTDVTGTITGYTAAFASGDSTPLYFGATWSSTDNGSGPEPNIVFGRATLAAYSVGRIQGLSDSAGRVAFYNATQAFQTALGRNV
jgi:hypothetical protein